jgi:Mo-co oxidoreductase dimerisation domain
MAAWPPERLDQAPIAQMMPVQSFICNPPQNTILGGKNTTSITLKGVAWSGGGREVQRVDVSIDGGKTWTAAELYKPIKQKWNRHWAWTQFYKTMELPEDVKIKLRRGENVRLDLVSKALNSDFNVQPERMEPYWNARGVAINHWYHVNVSPMRPNLAWCHVKGVNHCWQFEFLRPLQSVYRPYWIQIKNLVPCSSMAPKLNLVGTLQAAESLQFHGICTAGQLIRPTTDLQTSKLSRSATTMKTAMTTTSRNNIMKLSG